MASVGGWAGLKIGSDVFLTRQIQHLHIEFGSESQMALLLLGNGGRNGRQCSHERFVVCPQLKDMTFTKLVKRPDYCMCSQQFTVECGITRLSVSQFSGEKTKWLPMVP